MLLRKRVITGVLGGVIVVCGLAFGLTAWRVVVSVGCLWAMLEFAALARQSWYQLCSVFASCVVLWMIWGRPAFNLPLAEAVVAAFLAIPVLLGNRTSVQQSAFVAIGALYIGFGGLSLVSIRATHPGWAWLLLYLFSIWATDTAAYFVGGAVGGPKLWPSVSPNKTVSGAVGGLAAAAVVAVAAGCAFIRPSGWSTYLIFGVVCSLFGQLGDLVESAYKRTAGVKDSGSLLPGHGGMLDRVDGLLFAAPAAAWMLAHGVWMHI
ncbi:MAG: phosphatidate cytidylyltransferase [Alicyclobacillus sp.]|nr:phosphatidate cytidylyltransferase [Alicyclobacillus sp.]